MRFDYKISDDDVLVCVSKLGPKHGDFIPYGTKDPDWIAYGRVEVVGVAHPYQFGQTVTRKELTETVERLLDQKQDQELKAQGRA